MPVDDLQTGSASRAGRAEHGTDLDRELAGLDALELATVSGPSRIARLWSAAWPKIAAIAIALLAWQAVVWSEWKPEYVLAGPDKVLPELWRQLTEGDLVKATGITMRRALTGFALSIVVGSVIGAFVARVRLLRVAVGSLITGLQTMPSIAWFPLAILLFKLSESAILFVVVIGAAPAIANGLIAGTDQVPPILLRAGRVIGAKGIRLYRHVVLPASLPSYVAGLKQGWAFSWRSLMAGELLVIIANKPSIGVQLQLGREFANSELLLSTMLVILVIGIVVDSLLFGTLERTIRRRRGLIDVGL
jgi:NitT/TauT family transport system permease protein